jgi:predicted nucleic acid-binding protein
MKALIDTNILLDFFHHRADYEEASRLLSEARRGTFTACIAAHEVTTLGYFVEKDKMFGGDFRTQLSWLLDICEVLSIDESILRKAASSNITDYEDAVVECAAMQHDIDHIVTRDKKDFRFSRIASIAPRDFLSLLTSHDGDDAPVREPRPSYRTRPRRRQKSTKATAA